MDMKYGLIAEGSRVNAAIYRCFEYILDDDARKFVRKLAQLPHDGPQVMHTFRELILGAFLRSQGFPARYDWTIGNETPDWSLVDGQVKGVVELVNFHLDHATECEIRTTAESGRMWIGWPGSNVNRLYQRIWEKAVAYRDVRDKLGIPYVVAVFGLFDAFVSLDEVEECVYDAEHGLFKQYPALSGVLFFDENLARYRFTSLPNSNSDRPWTLPSGVFDLSERQEPKQLAGAP